MTDSTQFMSSLGRNSCRPIHIAIFIQLVHRQIGVLLHPLPHDISDGVLSRQHEFAAYIYIDKWIAAIEAKSIEKPKITNGVP